MTKLIIHAGFAKTGTTSVQTHCFEHFDELLKNKIYYSDVFLHDTSAHHSLAMMVKTNKLNLLEKGLVDLAEKSVGCNSTVLSSEEVCTLNSDGLSTLLSLALQHFTEIEVVYTVRPHYSLFIGSYKQQVREGYINMGLTEFWFLARKHARFLHLRQHYELTAELIKDKKISLTYVCTESGIPNHSGDIIKLFYHKIFKVPSLPRVINKEKKNTSLSSAQIVFLRECYYQIDYLWDKDVDWGHRRFVYYCFQNVSQRFKMMQKQENVDFLNDELLILESCKGYFWDDWVYLTKADKWNFPESDDVSKWYENKINSLREKVQLTKDSSNKKVIVNKKDRELFRDLFDFYKEYSNISSLGPSEQVAFYLNKIDKVN